MYVKCWGSRGSIPVSGEKFIKYGGDTPCIEIRTRDDQIIIIDAGTGIRRLGNHLIKEGRYTYNLIFTHVHWDHLMGLPFFKPIYVDQTDIHIQGCPHAQAFVSNMLKKIMSPPSFPVRYSEISANITYTPECPERIEIGSVTVIPIPLSHPNGGNGYKFVEDGRTFVFLTDNEVDFQHPGGFTFDEYKNFSLGADLLIHDGEYSPEEYLETRKWGHSVYTSALDLAISAKVKHFGIFHLNQDKTDDEIDRIVNECRTIIGKTGSDLKCFAIGTDFTIFL